MSIPTIPTIAALVEFLSAHDSAGLSRLRSTYQGAERILSKGTRLGAEESEANGKSRELDTAYIDTALTALDAVLSRVQPNLDYARARIGQANRLRLVGSLITAATGAGVLTSVLSGWPTFVSAAGAIVNLSASACTLVAAHIENPLHGDKQSISDLFESMIDTIAEAEPTRSALKIDLQLGRLSPEAAKRVERANVMAANLRTLELTLGTP
jgi:hypothetical protein